MAESSRTLRLVLNVFLGSVFFPQRIERRELAEVLLPLLKKDIVAQQVEETLGIPDEIVWDYTLFYSSTLIIYFDSESKVKNIASDLLSEITLKPDLLVAVSEVATEYSDVISEFKDQPYSRQEPAKKLLPLIKKGMLTKDVESILGLPDGKRWEYSLVHALSSTLIVTFSMENKLETAEITTSE